MSKTPQQDDKRDDEAFKRTIKTMLRTPPKPHKLPVTPKRRSPKSSEQSND